MRFWYLATAALLVAAAPAFAQGVPRVKAKVVSFDGQTLTVTSGSGNETMAVRVLPSTQYVRQEKRAVADIHQGDYLGATLTKGADGTLHAQEVHIFPESLRGSGEGLYPMAGQSGRSMINGTAYSATSNAGVLMLGVKYRGADGADGATCTGRAPRTGGCNGSTGVLVASGVPMVALLPADKSMLVPGAVLALSVAAGPDGRPVTPGLTIESLPSDGPPPDAAKPDSAKPAPRSAAPKGVPSRPPSDAPAIGN